MPDEGLPVSLDELLAHREWVRRVALALTRDTNDADDVEQSVWLAAARTPPERRESLKGWLGTSLRRAARGLRRTTDRRTAMEAALAASRPPADVAHDVAELAARADLHRRVVEAVVALDEPYRGTILLRYFEGLPVADVAARSGVPLETARARLRRGIERLRGRFRDRDGGLAALALVAGDPRRGAGSLASASAANAAGGGLVMGAKLWIAAGVVLVGLSVLWWAAGSRGAAVPGGNEPPEQASSAPRVPTEGADPPARAASPVAPAARAAASPPPVPPPPVPADATSRLTATRMTLRWEGAGLEPFLATIRDESGVEIMIPKASSDRLAGVDVNLTLEDVSALNALRTVTKVAGAAVDVGPDRVVVRPVGATAADDGELVRVRRLDELPHATVTFRVVGDNDVPVGGAEVLAEGRSRAFGTTDATGALTVTGPLPFPWALARLAGRVDSPATRVQADASAPTDVALRLGGTAAQLRGTLRTDGGRAVPGRTVQVFLTDGDRRRPLSRHALATDDAGAFADASCPPGTIVLVAQTEGFAYTEQVVDARPGDLLNVDLVLPPESVVTGVVRGPTGALAGSVRVTASIPTRRGLAVSFTDPEGRYRLAGLPAGTITVEARDLRSRDAATAEIGIGTGETRTWDAQLEPAPR